MTHSTTESKLRARAIPAILTVALGAFAFLPICDLHFDCGCTWPGAGSDSHCDIHTSGLPDYLVWGPPGAYAAGFFASDWTWDPSL